MKFRSMQEFKLWLVKQCINLSAKLVLKFVPKVKKEHISTGVFSYILYYYRDLMKQVYDKQAVPCDENYLTLLDAIERVFVYISERDNYYRSAGWLLMKFFGIYMQRYVPITPDERKIIWKVRISGERQFEIWGELIPR